MIDFAIVVMPPQAPYTEVVVKADDYTETRNNNGTFTLLFKVDGDEVLRLKVPETYAYIVKEMS